MGWLASYYVCVTEISEPHIALAQGAYSVVCVALFDFLAAFPFHKNIKSL